MRILEKEREILVLKEVVQTSDKGNLKRNSAFGVQKGLPTLTLSRVSVRVGQ
jgi:hypothetical protein